MAEYSPEFRNLLGAITDRVKGEKPNEYPQFYEMYPDCNAVRIEGDVLLLCGVYVEQPKEVDVYTAAEDVTKRPTIGYANFSKAGRGSESNLEHWLTMDGQVLKKVVGDPIGPSEFLNEDEIIQLTQRLI